MTGIVIAVAECAFAVFPGFAPEYAGKGNKKSVTSKMGGEALPNVGSQVDAAFERKANSRLTCQIEMNEELDGIVIHVADNDY